jgi:hypothetical protein
MSVLMVSSNLLFCGYKGGTRKLWRSVRIDVERLRVQVFDGLARRNPLMDFSGGTDLKGYVQLLLLPVH